MFKTSSKYPFFIDWISIYQSHSGFDLPVISSGFLESVDENGVIEFHTLKRKVFEGSFSSKITITCDGSTVFLSGNVGRWNRKDNLFGYSFDEVIDIANRLLESLDLPIFTVGRSMTCKRNGEDVLVYSGARVTRIDLTHNYATGSEKNAIDFMRWLSSQQDSRIKTGVYGESHTVDFGRGSNRLYHKVYNKYVQMQTLKDSCVCILDLLRDNGVVRHEITLKSRWLSDHLMSFMGNVTMDNLNEIYEEKAKVLSRADEQKLDGVKSIEDWIDRLSNPLKLTVRDYFAGASFRGKRSLYYKHRKELLSYGIDISVPPKVIPFPIPVRVIRLEPLMVPDWYWEHSFGGSCSKCS